VKPLTLDEIQAQLDAQDDELAHLTELAAALPNDLTLPVSALAELDEATELPPAAFATTSVPFFAIRG
jgi:hypothetical protein